jgi:hypothetical protein
MWSAAKNMMARWLASLLAVGSLGVGLRPAGAAELLLVHPAPCAIGGELSARTERALGRPLSSLAGVRFTIYIVHDHGSVAARLESERRGAPSQLRAFRAPSCEKLTSTLALAVVLALATDAPPSSPVWASWSRE